MPHLPSHCHALRLVFLPRALENSLWTGNVRVAFPRLTIITFQSGVECHCKPRHQTLSSKSIVRPYVLILGPVTFHALGGRFIGH